MVPPPHQDCLTRGCVGRFIAVQIPLNYNRRQIDLRQLILISTTWIFAFAVASPVIFGLNNVPDRDPSLCQLEDDNYIVYSSICSFFIPCPVMLVLYCGMFQGLKRWEEARKAKLRGCIYGANRKLYHPPTLMEREQTRLGSLECSPYGRAGLPGECGMNNGIQTVSYPHLRYPQPGHGRKRAKINGRERKAMRVLPVVVGEWLSGMAGEGGKCATCPITALRLAEPGQIQSSAKNHHPWERTRAVFKTQLSFKAKL